MDKAEGLPKLVVGLQEGQGQVLIELLSSFVAVEIIE